MPPSTTQQSAVGGRAEGPARVTRSCRGRRITDSRRIPFTCPKGLGSSGRSAAPNTGAVASRPSEPQNWDRVKSVHTSASAMPSSRSRSSRLG